MDDTIVALASGALPAAIAVVRVSGPEALAVAARLAGTLPPPRRAGLRSLRAADGTLLDRALVLTMPGPASPTGEDVVELHLHGGRAVVRAVEQELLVTDGVRRAEAGEFTRRALEHGRLDLTEVEGLADLLAAETEAQRRAALLMADGAVQRGIGAMQRELLMIGARIEALLDFGDEDDVAGAVDLARVQRDCERLEARLDRWLSHPTVTRLHDGFAIVLAGPPNAGKSSLLNVLAGREAAIVTDIPGTTRDRIDVPVVRNGKAFRLTDTAGLVETTADRVEAIGIERARMAMNDADIVLWLGDDDVPPGNAEAIALHARCDLPGRTDAREGRVSVSARMHLGIELLWSAIERIVDDRIPPSSETSVNDRQHALLVLARDAIAEAGHLDDPLLMAEQVRRAGGMFDRITGRGGVEALLDALFTRFCIGK